MSVPDSLSPRDFLRTSEFSPDRANQRFPHAQDRMLGGLFISHSGEDSIRIQEQIISPVVFERLPADGYFMHSRHSGGAESYRLLVQAALHWCDKFMVVISERSVSNPWVVAEVEWAVDNSRPVLASRFDSHGWKDLKDAIGACELVEPEQVFDFLSDVKRAQQELGHALDRLLVKLDCRDEEDLRSDNAS